MVVSAYVIEVSAPVGCGPTEALEICYWPHWMSLGYVCLIERHPKPVVWAEYFLYACTSYVKVICMARKPGDSIRSRAVCETRTREVSAVLFQVLLLL